MRLPVQDSGTGKSQRPTTPRPESILGFAVYSCRDTTSLKDPCTARPAWQPCTIVPSTQFVPERLDQGSMAYTCLGMEQGSFRDKIVQLQTTAYSLTFT